MERTTTLYALILLAEIGVIGWLMAPPADTGIGNPHDAPAVDIRNRSPMDFVVKKPGKMPPSRLKSNLDTTYDGYLYDVGTVQVRTNSAGFRDAPYREQKSNGTYRIIVVGDSFTFGWGVRRNDTYVEQLEYRLRSHLSGEVQVLNFGIPGYDTREEVQLLRSEGIAYNPDLVLVGYTTDEDLLPHTLNAEHEEELETYRESLDNTLSAQQRQMKVNLRRHELRLAQYREEDINTSWGRIREPLSQLENYSERYGFEVGLFTHTYYQPAQERRLRATAEDFGWLYIRTNISRDAFPQYKLSEEDWHLNRAGHDHVAAHLATMLRSRITGSIRPR